MALGHELDEDSPLEEVLAAWADGGLSAWCDKDSEGDHHLGFLNFERVRSALSALLALEVPAADPRALETAARLESDGWSGTGAELLEAACELNRG